MAKIKWKIDPAHSEIQFKVRHLMISTVTGHFKKFDATIETETDDFATASKIEFSAEIDSISTNNEQRDNHLKSEDFFHGDKHPKLHFSGTDFKVNGDEAELHGKLTIKDVTKDITLHVEQNGTVVDGYGQTKAGFNITGKISRKEFGLTWNAVTETGSVVVSDEIRINADVQMVKQTESVPA